MSLRGPQWRTAVVVVVVLLSLSGASPGVPVLGSHGGGDLGRANETALGGDRASRAVTERKGNTGPTVPADSFTPADEVTPNATTNESGNASTIVVSGRAAYTVVREGAEHVVGLPNVVVRLYDVDGGGRLLSETRTTEDGSFRFSVDARNDADGDEVVEAEIVVLAENDAVYVTDGDSTYSYSTRTGPLSGGQNVTVGADADGDGVEEFLPAGDNAPYQAVDWAADPHEFAAEHGVDKTKLPVVYPENVWAYYWYRTTGDEEIQLSGRTERWNRYTVAHEYGHALHTQLVGYDIPDKGTYECHVVTSETDPTYALREGFAEYFGAVIVDDPEAVSWSNQTIETNQFYDTRTRRCVDGDADGEYDGLSVEGAVASIFWDITDGGPNDDDPLNYSFGAIVDVLEHDPEDMNEFYERWDRGQKDALAEVYTRYGIDKQPPAVDPRFRASPYAGPEVVLAGTATDDEVAVERVELAVDGGPYTTVATDGGHWTATRTLADGNHTVTVRATDVNGNTEQVTRTVRVSSTPPAAEIDTERLPAFERPNRTVAVGFEYEARYPGGATVRVRNESSVVATASTASLPAAPAGGNGSVRIRLPAKVADGSYDLELLITDASNRTNTTRADDALRVDSQPPELTADAHRFTDDGEVAVSGSVTDANLSTLVISTPNGTERRRNESGNYTATVPLANEPTTVVVVATDAAGNTARQELTIGRDRARTLHRELGLGSDHPVWRLRRPPVGGELQ